MVYLFKDLNKNFCGFIVALCSEYIPSVLVMVMNTLKVFRLLNDEKQSSISFSDHCQNPLIVHGLYCVSGVNRFSQYTEANDQ